LDWASVILGAFIGVAGVFGLTSLALFPLMRRSFLLWNLGRTLGFCLIAIIAHPLASGNAVLDWIYQNLGDIGVAISAACSGPFLASYLERGLGLERLRTWLRASGVLGVAAAIATPLANSVPIFSLVHDVLLLVLVGGVIAGLTVAIRAGSRAARYQASAWGPLLAVGLGELIYELLTGHENPVWPLAVLFAVVIDFMVTSIGLIDGFLLIKRERDEAIADVRKATRESTLDPLTGIANRRGLAWRFDDPAHGRPAALAVIDCDHFKRINDNFGHDVGDEVLVAVAKALEGEYLFVGRLGGEEFVALVYGPDWKQTAEAARRRIEIGVRMGVPAIAFPVTASAGVAAIAADDTLKAALKRADRALYAAKDAGRDCSLVYRDTDMEDASLHRAVGTMPGGR
jgi:diguanylate cyclase (GGDEF)-like protein